MASLRLKKICNLVDENSIVADIGTDHGIIPIELSKNNMSKKIIATDISKSCLEKLEQKLIYNSNIVNIETRVSDGLDCFDEFEVDTIIISGMGGILIKEILEKNGLTSPIKQGYMFKGWNIENTTKINEDTIIKALWSRIE